MSTSIYFGGPWYRSVHPKLVISAMRFAVESPAYGHFVDKTSFTDGMLDIGRNLLMQKAIDSGCRWLVSVDADVSFDGKAKQICQALNEADRQTIALVAAPLELPDGAANVVDIHGNRLPWDFLSCGRHIQTSVLNIGFGFVAFHLGWYINNWPKTLPYFQSTVERYVDGGFAHRGEDYNHCADVRRMNGQIICDPRIGAIHEMGRTVK